MSATFDQRPGELEATRGVCSTPLVYGQCDDEPREDGEAWRVVLVLPGQGEVALGARAARAVAEQLRIYAELCENGNGLFVGCAALGHLDGHGEFVR